MAKLLWVCAMGSPVSPIVANFWVEQFKREALSNFPRPPEIWFRRVDDTFPKLHIYDIEHFNSRDPHGDGIQRKATLPRYVLIKTEVTIYRKPTHTDQYLNFNLYHHLEHKRSAVRTLFHRAETVIKTIRQGNWIEKS